MRLNHFENLIPVWKVVDLSLLFLYLVNETLYGYHVYVIDFFTPYDEMKNLRYVPT